MKILIKIFKKQKFKSNVFWKKWIKKIKKTNFCTIAKKAVTEVGAPSYTSGHHIWKGAAANLNNKPIPKKIKPINKAKLKSSSKKLVNCNKLIICLMSSKLVLPVKPYNNEEPNKIKPDEKAPNTNILNQLHWKFRITS